MRASGTAAGKATLIYTPADDTLPIVLDSGDSTRFRDLAGRLVAAPRPAGEPFDTCRRLLAKGARGSEAAQALRVLLEGAMADAATSIADAQTIMVLLKAADRGLVRLEELLVS